MHAPLPHAHSAHTDALCGALAPKHFPTSLASPALSPSLRRQKPPSALLRPTPPAPHLCHFGGSMDEVPDVAVQLLLPPLGHRFAPRPSDDEPAGEAAGTDAQQSPGGAVGSPGGSCRGLGGYLGSSEEGKRRRSLLWSSWNSSKVRCTKATSPGFSRCTFTM